MLKIQKLPGCLALAAAAATAAYAQTYPNKPIYLYIPFAAGGPTDTLGRNLAQAMGKPLKVQLIVENVVGAGGTIAINSAAEAVRIWIATDGARQEGVEPGEAEAYSQIRRMEARTAARALRVPEPEFGGLPDRDLAGMPRELDLAVRRQIEDFRPSLILCPSPVEVHPDHRAPAGIAARGSARVRRPTKSPLMLAWSSLPGAGASAPCPPLRTMSACSSARTSSSPSARSC